MCKMNLVKCTYLTLVVSAVLIVDTVNSSPISSVHVTDDGVEVKAGERVDLKCGFQDGTDISTCRWTRPEPDGAELLFFASRNLNVESADQIMPYGDRVTLAFTFTECDLKIWRTELNDTGKWECTVESDTGRSLTRTVGVAVFKPAGVAITTVPPRPFEVSPGLPALVKCRVGNPDAFPEPDVTAFIRVNGIDLMQLDHELDNRDERMSTFLVRLSVSEAARLRGAGTVETVCRSRQFNDGQLIASSEEHASERMHVLESVLEKEIEHVDKEAGVMNSVAIFIAAVLVIVLLVAACLGCCCLKSDKCNANLACCSRDTSCNEATGHGGASSFHKFNRLRGGSTASSSNRSSTASETPSEEPSSESGAPPSAVTIRQRQASDEEDRLLEELRRSCSFDLGRSDKRRVVVSSSSSEGSTVPESGLLGRLDPVLEEEHVYEEIKDIPATSAPPTYTDPFTAGTSAESLQTIVEVSEEESFDSDGKRLTSVSSSEGSSSSTPPSSIASKRHSFAEETPSASEMSVRMNSSNSQSVGGAPPSDGYDIPRVSASELAGRGTESLPPLSDGYDTLEFYAANHQPLAHYASASSESVQDPSSEHEAKEAFNL